MCVCTSLSLVSVIANITNTNILVQNTDIIAGGDNVRICAHIHMCAWMNTYVRNQRLGGGGCACYRSTQSIVSYGVPQKRGQYTPALDWPFIENGVEAGK